MQLHCWLGVKIIDVSGNPTDPSFFVPGHRNFLCFVLKVFESQRLIQFISGWIQWNNAFMPFRVIPGHTFWYQSIGGGTSF